MSDDILTKSQIKMLNQKQTISSNKLINSFFTFWIYIFKKIIFSCTSVKVWSLVGLSWLNAWLVVNSYINGSNFAAIQICLISTVLVAREFSKKSHSNGIISAISDNPIVQKIANIENSNETSTETETE